MRDLERQTEDDFPYEFDRGKAERACAFFPLFLRHSKGEWSGHPFELSDWQLFVIACIFGWVRKSDGMRRFRKAYISLGRKQGKSTLAAGIALLLLILDREPGAEVYCSATKRDQSRIVHNEAKAMVRSSPALRKFATVHQSSIMVQGTNSFFHPVSSDRPLDGPNPHGVIFDELHAWREQHRDFYETMTTGGAARRQPLELTITTAGNDKSLLWLEAEQAIRDIVRDRYTDDSVFGFICELDEDDDPFDEDCWPKSNPNLGVSVKLSYLRDQSRDAQSAPTKRNAFIRYHGNRKVSSVEDAITEEQWKACEGDLSDWSQADYVGGGIDLGGRDDLAAFAHCARFHVATEVVESEGEQVERPVWRYEIRSTAFLEASCKRDLDRQPWSEWIYQGQLILSESLIPELRDRFADTSSELGCQSFAFDPYNARQIATELEQEGLVAVKMAQNYGHFNEPLMEFLKAVREGRLTHDGDPVLGWCALNMTVKEGARGEKMPAKDHSREKIDAAVAAIMAFRECYFAEEGSAWTFKDGAQI